MKVYIVVSEYETSYDYEECFVTDIEAVFTDIRSAVRYIISHKDESDDLRIVEYEADDVTYLCNAEPKKIVMGKYSPKSLLHEKKVTYSYFCCEEIIEREDCVLLSTTVPVEMSDEEAFEILKLKYENWMAHNKKEV